ncbi:hypothetical protein [Micromonospora musae]|uniref:hypothetical protein n=1 Tax=Micromonospora musae TaxID=1894970 RepID=UPI0013151508|nr:hypothetical protein [Micromonospora musae]
MQITAPGWSLRRSLAVGTALLVSGIGLAVVAAWLGTPSLTLFVIGAVLSGAGASAGAMLRGVLGTTAAISTRRDGPRRSPTSSSPVTWACPCR